MKKKIIRALLLPFLPILVLCAYSYKKPTFGQMFKDAWQQWWVN